MRIPVWQGRLAPGLLVLLAGLVTAVTTRSPARPFTRHVGPAKRSQTTGRHRLSPRRAEIRQEQAYDRALTAARGGTQSAPGRPAPRTHDHRANLARRRLRLVPAQRAANRRPRRLGRME